MDPRELNQMFEQLAPTPEQMQRGLNRLLQEERKGYPVKRWKRAVLAVVVAALLVTVAAAANPELLGKLTLQLFPDDSSKGEGYTVSGSLMTKYPLSAFSPNLIAASEGRLSGEEIPCVWPGGGENWQGWFQVVLFHTEYGVLWGVDIIGCDLEKAGAKVWVKIRTEHWPYSEASASYSIAEGSLTPSDSYAMANGAVAEIVQYQGTEEHPGRHDYTGYFMREGILYTVIAMNTITTEGTEEQLKEILDSFQ